MIGYSVGYIRDTMTMLIKTTYNDFTYNIKTCDITNMFLFTVKSKISYK